MTKKLKNIFISLFGVLAFLFAGVFFVGCGINYNKISLSADVASVNLQVGEEKDITFTIDGYQKGFNNKIQIMPSNGLSSVFVVAEGSPTYIGKDKIRITIRGVAGGSGTLTIRTYEAAKECSVDVSVEEFSSSMIQRNSTLYVSNKTAFKPSADLFEFPANTTNKNLSFFYITGDKPAADLNTYRLQLDGNVITFVNGQETIQRTVVPFNEIRLLEENDQEKLVAVYNGAQTELELRQSFMFVAIYTHSLTSGDYSTPIFVASEVQVLKDIKLNISGGYLQSDGSVTQLNEESTERLNFKPLTDGKIIIVPNNSKMLQYVLKIETESFENLNIDIDKSNEDVIVDFISGDTFDSTDNVKYLKISQNSMKQASTTIKMNVYYQSTKNVQDESVNTIEQIVVETQVAPKYITVNGLLEAQKLVMYNQYTSPEYGWRDLGIEVISEFETSPTFKGIYFEYNSDYIEMLYNGSPVIQGEGMLYSDLDTPFQVRGKLTANPVDNEVIKIVLLSDILSDGKKSLEISVPYQIKAGATSVSIDTPYQNYRYFYLDADWQGEFKQFNRQLFANHEFQSITAKYISGLDVVEFDTHPNEPCQQDSDKENVYWLNLSLNVKTTGIGIYDIILDNGITRRISFNVIDTLKPSTTEIKMSNEGNQNVQEYSFGKYWTEEQDPGFNNLLKIQILNPSTRDSISFGNTASFEIISNVVSGAVTYNADNGYVMVSQVGNRFNVTTLANGVTQITFTLKGNIVDEISFQTSEAPNIIIMVEVTSYSLVDEFYLKNGDSLALSNIVYYGNADSNENNKLTFTPVANNGQSSNFQRYSFEASEFVRLFGMIENGTLEGIGNEEQRDENGNIKQDEAGHTIYDRYRYDVDSSAFSKMVKTEYVPESYVVDGTQNGDKFISFTVLNENGGTLDETVTDVTITKNDGKTNVQRTIRLFFFNSLMFRGEDVTVSANDATYTIHFSNVYEFVYGSFDMNSFTYTHTYPSATRAFVLSANLRQRDNSKRYDARIVAQRYNAAFWHKLYRF